MQILRGVKRHFSREIIDIMVVFFSSHLRIRLFISGGTEVSLKSLNPILRDLFAEGSKSFAEFLLSWFSICYF